jgi:uncharacterized small protein (DUF1192 family)
MNKSVRSVTFPVFRSLSGITFLPTLYALTLLSGCQAYRELQRQERENYAYVKSTNVEIQELEARRAVLLEERARLSKESASLPAPRQGTSRSSQSQRSGSSSIQQRIAANQAALNSTEAQLRQARLALAR